MYEVTLRQSGELGGFIKSLVVTVNGAKLVHQESGKSYDGAAALGDEELTGQTVTLATDGKAIEFAVSGGAVDRDGDGHQRRQGGGRQDADFRGRAGASR